ncbi:MAG: VCBS repeat-containing protein [Cytophagaceae bacterium]|nr:VCBS repeat-containing protein [Cytophagaceae bacterium]
MRQLLFLLFGSVWLLGCPSAPKTGGPPAPTSLSGEALARIHCQSCHVFPDPALLDKKTWKNGVLPNMKMRLGVSDAMPFSGMEYEDILEIAKTDAYPARPQLARSDMDKIEQYYLSHAPDSLPAQPTKPPVTVGLPGFETTFFRLPKGGIPMVTHVNIDPARHQTAIAEQSGRVRMFDKTLRLTDSLRAETAVSDVLPPAVNKAYWILTMGIMPPNDLAKGALYELTPGQPVRPLLPGLRRPVEVTRTDLNADNVPDALVCNYGNHAGSLAWYELGGKTPVEHVLSARPGARCTHVADFDHDGRPDVLALFAQGLEGISLFYNEGAEAFREEVVLSFPPVYGSSYLSVVDFDADGDLDLLYANGDNADYSYLPKPYHGIRLFTNDGKNHFRQAWFYPLNGTQQVEARDFDGDGDLDVAAIAFFPDPQKPKEGFVYLKNEGSPTGNRKFSAHTFPKSEQGRWLTMDCGDVDGDGDDDIVLGSYLRRGANRVAPLPEGLPEFVVLKNGTSRLRASAR